MQIWIKIERKTQTLLVHLLIEIIVIKLYY